MTHAELQESLPAYADGTLADATAEQVRAHLATGCAECLGGVFTRPVGLPRPQPLVVRRRAPAVMAAMAAGAAALGLGVGALAGILWAPPAPLADPSMEALAGDVSRLRAEQQRVGTDQRERLARLEDALERVAQRAAARETPATTVAPPTVPPSTAAAPPAEPPPPAADADAVPQWLEELLSYGGGRVMALGAADFAPDASGYAIWSPARGVVVVSASGLPSGEREAVYRVRVDLSDGSTVWVGDLTAGERGTVLITVAIPAAEGRRVVGVDLYRDPPGAPVLAASLAEGARGK